MDIPCVEDMGQTAVAAPNSLRHLILTEAVECIIPHSGKENQNHSAYDEPNPYRNTRILTFRIEPLILDGLQPILSLQA